LEQKLHELEKAYLNKHHPKRSEDDITETRFKILKHGSKYDPLVIELKLK